MITIDDVEYSEEEMTYEAKIRAQRISQLREEHINLVLRQQEVEQSITFPRWVHQKRNGTRRNRARRTLG